MDVCLVLAFATVGRASHDEGLSVSSILGVAWPFLVSLALGWLLARRLSRGGWPVRVPGSPVVWLATVVGGLALRVLAGGGFAWSFGLVTLLVLGIFLIGWRCAVEVARFLGESLARSSTTASRRDVRH